MNNPVSLAERLAQAREWLARLRPERLPVPAAERWRGALAATAAILLTGLVSRLTLGEVPLLLVASLGASSVLLFALPANPLAQPWPFVGGHLVAAAVGVSCARFVPDPMLAAALAVGLSILAMYTLRCLHPPGGAVALIPILGGEAVHELGYRFLLAPVLLNVLVMLALAVLINNRLPGRLYPNRPRVPNPHRVSDAAPLQRAGLGTADIERALAEFGQPMYIGRAELRRIVELAEEAAYRRQFSELLCRDVMTRDVMHVTAAAPAMQAWKTLYFHKVKALPVVDAARQVVGIITVADFLRRANLPSPGHLRRFVLNLRDGGDEPGTVGELMSAPVFTVREDVHIAELVPMLSDRNLHHVPVVDARGELAGIITQSDLIAALYRGRVAEAMRAG